MPERSADRHDRGLDLLLGCAEDPSIKGSRRLNCIGTGVKVDSGQHGVDKGPEASPAWPLAVATLHDLDPDVRTKPRGRIFGLPSSPPSLWQASSAPARASDVTVRTESEGWDARASSAWRASLQAA
jgi:hypothetical protein